MRDDATAKRIKDAEGKRVALHYKEKRGIPSWLELNKEQFAGTIKNLPVREEITLPIQEQLIVEFYSRF